jgi:hypothetical protein
MQPLDALAEILTDRDAARIQVDLALGEFNTTRLPAR